MTSLLANVTTTCWRHHDLIIANGIYRCPTCPRAALAADVLEPYLCDWAARFIRRGALPRYVRTDPIPGAVEAQDASPFLLRLARKVESCRNARLDDVGIAALTSPEWTPIKQGTLDACLFAVHLYEPKKRREPCELRHVWSMWENRYFVDGLLGAGTTNFDPPGESHTHLRTGSAASRTEAVTF